jgi:hypothetical protein
MPCSAPIEDQFTHSYEGYKALLLTTIAEVNAVEAALTRTGVSYQTRIVRSKKHGLTYVITLVGAVA